MRYMGVIAAALAGTAQAAKDERTFAVLRFFGDGPLMEGRVDPIVSPGQTSAHVHTIQGGSNFGISATGESLMESQCSSALIEGDNSAYWVPKLHFYDKTTGTVEGVPMYYMNIYYFFEPTDDDIVAFPIGLQMFSGNASLRECPNFGGEDQLDGGDSPTNPLQWTCPRSSYSPASWPSASESDGSKAGIQDPSNQQAGQGFPFADCDGEYSPLRQDLHFPSCYDPSKGLTDYENNMVFPTTVNVGGVVKQNCPTGFVHVPHLFYEMYWNTIDFKDRWSSNQGEQPFVLANGDLSGCSGHGDFMAAWDTDVLQHIIDTCNAGDSGMDLCAGITVRDKSTSCQAASPMNEVITGNLTALPGNNPLEGWGITEGSSSTLSPAALPSTLSSVSDYAISPSEGGIDIVSTQNTAGTTPTSSAPAQQTTVNTQPASVNNLSAKTTVETLRNGQVITKTVVDWVTVTTWVSADLPVATETVQAKRDAHVHKHLFRHRTPHQRRR